MRETKTTPPSGRGKPLTPTGSRTGTQAEYSAAYAAYIQSDEWRAVRKRYRDSKFPWKCAVCGVATNLHLHHRTYKRLGKERLGDLIPLCQFHHEETHRVERSGVRLWVAHTYVLVNKTILPSEPKKRSKFKQKTKIVPPRRVKNQRKKQPDALQCTGCHALYPERHKAFRCECGGYILYRKTKQRAA